MSQDIELSIKITHIYPKHLNIYGDTGNLTCLKQRCLWRDIDVEVDQISTGKDTIPNDTDIYIMGGGQDNDQIAVVTDFKEEKRNKVIHDLQNDVVFLGVCGGYQLMGKSYVTGDRISISGLGLLDIETRAPDKEVKSRCIGNLVVEINPHTLGEMMKIYTKPREIPNTLVGFENHSGQTYFLSEDIKPLGKTLSGFGNNSEGKIEGARYRNIFGSYMHGPLLSKNPHFADYLIWLALIRKYNDRSILLKPLDDNLEYIAHNAIIKKLLKG